MLARDCAAVRSLSLQHIATTVRLPFLAQGCHADLAAAPAGLRETGRVAPPTGFASPRQLDGPRELPSLAWGAGERDQRARRALIRA
jgi:hypothetical protein